MGAKTQINVTRKGKIADILIFFAVKMHGTTYIPTEEEELPNGDFVSKFKVSMEEGASENMQMIRLHLFSLFIKLFHLFILSFQEKSVPLSTNQ